MSNLIKAVFLILAFGSCVLALDALLPTEEIDTTVNHLTKQSDVLFFNVPLSGGELGSCLIGKDAELQALSPRAEIMVQKTAVLGRCVGIKPLPTEELECRRNQRAAQYQKAIELEQQRKLAEAESMYSEVCNSYEPPNHEEDPCKASLRLHHRLEKTYASVMAALSEYKSRTGKYPDSLSAVLPELPEGMREVAGGFTYCKKEDPSNRTAQCTDGGISFADSEISVGTGRTPPRPNPSVNRAPCQLSWQVPYALRAPVAGYVERWRSIPRPERNLSGGTHAAT